MFLAAAFHTSTECLQEPRYPSAGVSWRCAALRGAPYLCAPGVCGHLCSGKRLQANLQKVVSGVLLCRAEEGHGGGSLMAEGVAVCKGFYHQGGRKDLFLTVWSSLWEGATQHCRQLCLNGESLLSECTVCICSCTDAETLLLSSALISPWCKKLDFSQLFFSSF